MSAAKPRKATTKRAAARTRAKTVDERALTVSRAKERRAYELWLRGATPAQIAGNLWTDGKPMYESESGARAAIERAAAYMGPIGDTELLREQMLASLMADLVECNRILARRHPVLDRQQRVVMLPVPTGEVDPQTGEPLTRMEPADDDGIKVRVMAQKNRIWDQIARLQGTYAAAKFEFTGRDGGPIELEERRSKLLDRAAHIRLLPSAGEIIETTAEDVKEA